MISSYEINLGCGEVRCRGRPCLHVVSAAGRKVAMDDRGFMTRADAATSVLQVVMAETRRCVCRRHIIHWPAFVSRPGGISLGNRVKFVLAARRRAEMREMLRIELRRGLQVLPKDRHSSVMDWARAYYVYMCASRAFVHGGIGAALIRLPGRPSSLSGVGLFEARVAAWRLHTVGRTLVGEGLCLQESVALCAGLRQLGFPADLVLGAPVLELPENPEVLHAWTEVDGRLIDTRADVLPQPSAFVEFLRTGPGQDWA